MFQLRDQFEQIYLVNAIFYYFWLIFIQLFLYTEAKLIAHFPRYSLTNLIMSLLILFLCQLGTFNRYVVLSHQFVHTSCICFLFVLFIMALIAFHLMACSVLQIGVIPFLFRKLSFTQLPL